MTSKPLRNKLKLPVGALLTAIIQALKEVDSSFDAQTSMSQSLQYLPRSVVV
jgi:hypothetical protein